MMDRVAERIRMGQEDAQMLANIDQAQLDALTNAINEANRIYVAGWGRAGNCVKILGMDCSQMGMTAFICGDNTTPSIHEGDILVIGSGGGETKTMAILAEQAKQHGAKLGLITKNADSTIGKLADYVVEIKSLPTNPGVSEIFVPGEIEQRRRAQRKAEGIELSDVVYEELRGLGEKYGAEFTI